MNPLIDGLGARVELALAQTRLYNALNYARTQWRQHLGNALAIAAALTVFWWHSPLKLSPGAWRDYANWALLVLCIGYFGLLAHRMRVELNLMASDWLSVQPVPLPERLRWLRTRLALRCSVELLLLSLLQRQFFGQSSGAMVLLLGALGSGLIIYLLPALPQPRLFTATRAQARYAAVDRPALLAWFQSEILTAANLRWWWLAVALLVPMSSPLLAIAILATVIAAALRAFAVLHACAQTLFHVSRLLQSQPLQPALMYRAALGFAARALTPSMAVLLVLLALVCHYQSLSLWLVPVGLIAAVLVAGTTLHFAFAYRHTPLNAMRRARAATLYCLAFALFTQMLAPALPLLCLALWRFFYLRGLRALEIK